MKCIVTIVCCSFSFLLNAQEGIWRPFKMLVIQPDTAFVETSFNSQKDTIEAGHLRNYYAHIKKMEELVNFTDFPKEKEQSFKASQQIAKREVEYAKAHEKDVKAFKYYQTISEYSVGVFMFYFNEYEPYSTILELPKHCTDLSCLKVLSDSAKADYIVFYKDIHSSEKEGLPVLKLTTYLYSKVENKIILTKETEGNTDSLGDMWACNYNVPLSCMLINSVKTSTDVVADMLRKRQIRKKN